MPIHRFDIAGLPATPWKNGGGTTREIVCQPLGADMDNFDWRVSIASITQAGSFSAFPGIDRVIMLLDGDGVQLQAPAAGILHRMDKANQPFSFSGDVALDCTLLGGASTDFNVMSRRGTLQADVSVLNTPSALSTSTLSSKHSGLLLVLRGNWTLVGAEDAQCAAGQGLWWADMPQAWQVTPQEANAVLVSVRLNRLAS